MGVDDAVRQGPSSMDAILHEIRASTDGAAISVEERVSLSSTSVEALLALDDAAEISAAATEPESEPVPSLEALLRETPDGFGVVADGPGSLEALFHDLADDPDEWFRPAARRPARLSVTPPGRRSTLRPLPLRNPAASSAPPSLPPRRKKSTPPTLPAPRLASTKSIPASALPPDVAPAVGSRPSVAPVSMSAPLSLEADALAEDSGRLGRRLGPAAYVMALVGAGAVGAWLGSTGELQLGAPAPLAMPGTLGALADRTVAATQAVAVRATGAPRAEELPAETSGVEPSETDPPRLSPGTVPTASWAPQPASAATQTQRPTGAAGQGDDLPPAGETDEPAATATAAAAAEPFNRQLANQALQGAAATAAGCARGDHAGTVRVPVAVTFAPSGRVTTAVVTGSDLAGTPAGSCVAQVFRQARVPPYAGSFVTVTKTITLR